MVNKISLNLTFEELSKLEEAAKDAIKYLSDIFEQKELDDENRVVGRYYQAYKKLLKKLTKERSKI